ncbi:hypothetical protein [Pseudoroseomonas ludipueritiae]|uniref:Uncharacterized protein n=1 Tax=Pseudoroseomonas ludipueritiae TaxID=198093 RepID=A0ABR7RA03_9PROT|nr:hypothetical protein [Pseudoroseomonas ludipueritiae]MBC9178657.1 hypothetical protein [Pseudoroseomonas ludipueritiae]MCG7359772.1 hypothetical protein [Roseomonas sp. ACRSG]
MKAKKLLLLAVTGAFLVAPLTSAMADPWKDESGHGRYERRWERHEERRWRERERRAERHWRHEQRERRAEYERHRAYEQGRRDGYRDSANRNPLEAIGQLWR